jgi:hypothetical protein
MATLDGNPVFGFAVHVVHSPRPNAQQMNEYFGLNGLQTLFGGQRGRMLMISGVLVGQSLGDITAAESALLSFADGQAHTLFDDRGREFDNVIFRGEYQPFEQGPRPTDFGWCLPYRCVMEGLS